MWREAGNFKFMVNHMNGMKKHILLDQLFSLSVAKLSSSKTKMKP